MAAICGAEVGLVNDEACATPATRRTAEVDLAGFNIWQDQSIDAGYACSWIFGRRSTQGKVLKAQEPHWIWSVISLKLNFLTVGERSFSSQRQLWARERRYTQAPIVMLRRPAQVMYSHTILLYLADCNLHSSCLVIRYSGKEYFQAEPPRRRDRPLLASRKITTLKSTN